MYMLDTDTVSLFLRGEGNVPTNISKKHPSELCVSAITVAELRFGADKRRSRNLHRLINTLMASLQVVPFDRSAAGRYGEVAARLERAGTPIGVMDSLIAAHALAIRAVVVTRNIKHFKLVHGLNWENWTD